MNKKGIVLFISMFVLAIILVLIGAYFSSLMTEKRASDTEEYVLQALTLAEAGADHALAELRQRIRTDLKAMLEPPAPEVTQSSVIQAYVTNNDPLGFLRNYAYAAGDTQFNVAAGEATLNVPTLNLTTSIQGSYSANIIITPNGNPTNPEGEKFVFPYKFSIESSGQVTRGTGTITRNMRLLQGVFTVTVVRDTLAKYALFTFKHQTEDGTTVWFTANTNFTGPVHTNERFSFANNPSGSFSQHVTQSYDDTRFYNNGNPVRLENDHNGTRDVPIFDEGFERGYETLTLETSVSQSDLKSQALGGTSEPGTNGIYVPLTGGTTVAGGIFIRGDSSMAMDVDANGRPTYTLTRGTNTKKITVDYANNTTIVENISGSGGTAAGTYQGTPNGTGNEGIIIYSRDNVTFTGGAGHNQVVQANTALTISSEDDIIIGDNIRYEHYTPDDPGTPANELSSDGNNVLGLISWSGDVRIGTGAPDDVEIHAVIMAPDTDGSSKGEFKVDNYSTGDPRGTATLLGGVISGCYGAFGTFSGDDPTHGYGRNFVYDARMLQGMTPPYFPYMTNFTSSENGLENKLVWQDQGV